MTLLVLQIENDADDRYLGERTIKDAGYDVISVDDADAGIEAARNSPVDVIFCDVNMPKRNGYWVADTIKADPALRHIALIALTGAAGMFADEDRAKAAGFDAFMLKNDFDAAAVRDLVESLCPR